MDIEPSAENPTGDEPNWRRQRGSGGCAKAALAAVILGALVMPFLPWAKIKRTLVEIRSGKAKDREIIVEKRVEVPVPVPGPTQPPPLPTSYVDVRQADTAKLWNGIKSTSDLKTTQGKNASTEREEEESYTFSFQINLRIPAPSQSLQELKSINPNIQKLLPGLEGMLEKGKVSGFFHHIYETKRKDIQRDITRLDRVLSRHNFFDLETILELESPATKQKVLLIQSEMDVVSDGSDGDRMPTFDDYLAKSHHFQPTTSYAWPKLTTKPNPLLPRLEEELRVAKDKVARGTREEKAKYAPEVAQLTRSVLDLKKRSYLIAQEDPFIVIPSSLRKYQQQNAFTPAIGDYAVVIYKDIMLPAIVGDFGPSEKTGEASLRIARQLNPKAGPYNRAVSDLSVTYLIFPNSAEEPRQPRLADWHKRCTELLGKIGGIGEGGKLFDWEDHFAPKPAQPPAPSPNPPAKNNPP